MLADPSVTKFQEKPEEMYSPLPAHKAGKGWKNPEK